METSLLDKEWTLRFPHLALLSACFLGALTVAFGVWTATSVWSFPLFVLAVVLVVYVPGGVVLDAARARARPLDRLCLSLILGMTVSSVLYALCGLLRLQGLFALWPAATTGWRLYARWRAWPEWWETKYSANLTHLLLLVVILLCLVPLTVLPMYYRNLDLLPQGGMNFLRKPNDAVFHLSISNELTHSIPPQAPFLAGRPLGYHFGMDLLPAMFSRLAGVSVLDSTVRFFPTFLLGLAVLSVFSFSRLWLGSGAWAALCAFLVPLGEDFSFLPGLLTRSEEIWSAQFFGMPTTYSLYFMNPMLPALGVLFAGLFCLVKYWRGSGKNWEILSAFLFAVAVEYKIFATLHVLAALGLAGLVYFLLSRDRRLLQVAALTLLFAAPLVLCGLLAADAGSRVWIRIEPWPYIPEMLKQLGLLGTTLGREVDALFHAGGLSVAGLAALVLVAVPVYLVGSLGARVLAIPTVLRGLSSRSPTAGLGLFLSLFCVLGPLASLALAVTPWGYPSTSEYNNAVWFYVQSKYVLWVLAVQWLSSALGGKPRWWQTIAVAAVVVVSVPSSLQFFHTQASQATSVLTSTELEVTEAMAGRCPDGDVVMARQEVGELVVALTPCRVPVLNLGIYPHSFVSMGELAERRSDRDVFWGDWNEGTVRVDILERYSVGYVLLDLRAGDRTLGGPGVSGGEGPPPVGAVTLVPCFENEEFVVYSVSRGDGSGT
ncbi:MAG TPA: hypothetical protein VJ714_00595 [Anaerolineae bacterium]|nr:hypothetical protein [Anaerolineae bacterium]